MHRHDVGCYMHTFPIFRSTRCYAYHVCLHQPLAFNTSLHACLHIHAWILIASISSMLQHNEVMDIQSKPSFVPCGHHLLFAFLLVCSFACLLSCLFVYLGACHVSCHMLCLPYLSCLFALNPLRIIYASLSFHCLSTGFLSLPLHVHIWNKDAWS